jgi:hypothetical protein
MIANPIFVAIYEYLPTFRDVPDRLKACMQICVAWYSARVRLADATRVIGSVEG